MPSHRMLAQFHLIAVFLCIVFYYYPKDRLSSVQLLTEQCQYETGTLCPECFPEPVNCSFFENHITFDGYELMSEIVNRFNQHGVRFGLLNGERRVVIKNLNRNGAIQSLRDSTCEELGIEQENCHLRNNEQFLQLLRQRVLDEDLLEGAIICPPGDEGALARFVQKFDAPDLMTLLLMRTNVQPLVLRLLSQHNLPVPTFIFQGGFTLVESYDGEPLGNFYESPLNLRLKIANELIKASINFTTGVDHFRFYLTDISPDNIVVNVLPNNEAKVSFVDMNNVIILDSHSKRLDPDKRTTSHSRIDCDGCFAYVQEDLCTYHHSDINLFAVCQLLLENLNGNRDKGFLHNTENDSKLIPLRKLLHHCVYCQPPNCKDRQGVLAQIQEMIHTILT
ncbi:uncharacterized protein LOC135711715 [Ochlerotatus camptorhynchus]|uniref:uncharacterized protein LOC135711715 n=1 Tax=Ochlerotatus camptorhynchus TaxID=644619 RepID=UPI0031E37F0E